MNFSYLKVHKYKLYFLQANDISILSYFLIILSPHCHNIHYLEAIAFIFSKIPLRNKVSWLSLPVRSHYGSVPSAALRSEQRGKCLSSASASSPLPQHTRINAQESAFHKLNCPVAVALNPRTMIFYY